MRILIVTHSFAPELTPRAFRWAAIVRSLAASGHQVDVVCARPLGAPAQESMTGVEVHRVRDLLSRSSVGGIAGQKRRLGFLRRWVRWIYNQTWRRLYWPDYACAWYFPAVRRASALLAERKHDWIISVSHPFTGHLIGLALKRRNPKVPWLVDIGDPFCLMDDPAPNNITLYRHLSQRADRAVLRAAEVISVTTAGTRAAYARFFPRSAVKIHVIPPMLSLPTGAIADTARRDVPAALRLVYVGTLYRRLRSPAPLLSLFERLVAALPDMPLELHFLGNVNDSAELFRPYAHWLDSRLFVQGLVSRARAQQMMQDAHVLVNLGNRSATQLPSKVIEYVAMGKPILNLVTIPDDSSVGILASYPAALTLHVDGTMSESEVHKVEKFIANPPVVTAEAIQEWLMPYTEQSVFKNYLRLLLTNTVAAQDDLPACP